MLWLPTIPFLLEHADLKAVQLAVAERVFNTEIHPLDVGEVATALLAILCIQHGCSARELRQVTTTAEVLRLRNQILQAAA